MPTVQCPACERKLKVSDTVKSKAVRCPCGEKIVLDEPAGEERVSTRPARPAADKPRRAEEAGDVRPAKRRRSRSQEPIHGLLWLLIFTPVGIALIILAPMYKIAAQITATAGLALLIAAIVMVYRLGKRTGLN